MIQHLLEESEYVDRRRVHVAIDVGESDLIGEPRPRQRLGEEPGTVTRPSSGTPIRRRFVRSCSSETAYRPACQAGWLLSIGLSGSGRPSNESKAQSRGRKPKARDAFQAHHRVFPCALPNSR